MPDLERRVAAWRAAMRAALPGRDPVVDELEDHLRERTLDLTRRGLPLPEAFAQASAEIGQPGVIAPQFRSLRPDNYGALTAVRIVASILIIPCLLVMGVQFAAICGQLARGRISPYSDAAPAAFFPNLLVCSL